MVPLSLTYEERLQLNHMFRSDLVQRYDGLMIEVQPSQVFIDNMQTLKWMRARVLDPEITLVELSDDEAFLLKNCFDFLTNQTPEELLLAEKIKAML